MVVGLHTEFLGEISALGSYLSVNGIFRIAVPVFLVINGFYFFSSLTKGSQIDWIKRVLTLYVVWMLFYSYFWLSVPEISLMSIFQLIKSIVLGYHHLWYVSGMLGAAILVLLFKRRSSTFLVLTIITSYMVGVTIQYLGNYHYFEGSLLDKLFNMYWFHRNAFLFSYPFFCIGYLLNKHKVHEKVTLAGALLVSAIGITLLLFESYLNYYQEGREGGFDNYLSLLFVCPFIFVLFTKLEVRGNSKDIALYSSAIYFIHSFFLSVLVKFTELESTTLTISCILASCLASYFIIKINKKVGYIL